MAGFRYNAYSSWRTQILATANPGTGFTPLGDFPCDEVVIYVASGTSIDIISSSWLGGTEADTTQFVTAEGPAGVVLPVGGNANEIAVRRTNLSNTPITVRYVWRKFMR